MKKITSLLLALVMALSLAACAVQPRQEDYQSVNIRLGGLKGPTSMGMPSCWMTPKTASPPTPMSSPWPPPPTS